MKLKEAHYAETIHILIPNQLETWIKMGGSGELEEGDIPEQVWDTFKNKIANWIKTRRPELENGEAVIDREVEKSESVNITGDLKHDIETVSDLKVLKSYELIVKGNPDLKKAYDKKLKQLSK